MKYYLNLYLLALLAAAAGCQSPATNEEDFVFRTFKEQLTQKGIRIDSVDQDGLIYISHAGKELKVSLDNAPAMKEKIKAALGYPYCAVIPVRHMCYVFAEKDLSFFGNEISDEVVEEYKNGDHPISLEMFRFSDKGVQVVGKFNEK